MKVRLLEKWDGEHEHRAIGEVIDIPAMQAKRLLHLRRVELINKTETAALAGGRERTNAVRKSGEQKQ